MPTRTSLQTTGKSFPIFILPFSAAPPFRLALPGYEENLPTLEIFQYDVNEPSEQVPDRKGFGHIAFRTDDVPSLLATLIRHGGSRVGEMVETHIPGAGNLTFVYARDPDGNIIELQNWK